MRVLSVARLLPRVPGPVPFPTLSPSVLPLLLPPPVPAASVAVGAALGAASAAPLVECSTGTAAGATPGSALPSPTACAPGPDAAPGCYSVPAPPALHPVLLDTTACLSALYAQMLSAGLPTLTPTGFLHITLLAGLCARRACWTPMCPGSALNKQKMSKISAGLAAMDALASFTDQGTLRAAHGSTGGAQRQGALLVCHGLAELLRARLVFAQRALLVQPLVVPVTMTCNAFEQRVLALGAACSAAQRELLKASFVAPPQGLVLGGCQVWCAWASPREGLPVALGAVALPLASWLAWRPVVRVASLRSAHFGRLQGRSSLAACLNEFFRGV